jgi:chemotaxis response regulator CheB
MAAHFRIVSLCGSAGALPSYIEFLRMIPRNCGMAFVVLTHRRVYGPCELVHILSHITHMKVEEIENGMILQPNCVYVIPAGKDLTTDGEAFSLVPASVRYGRFNTFDIFLRSVAQTTLKRAITVIFSGGAEDGSAALAELRVSGGMNYAQANAQFPSMPQSAILTGKIDFVGSPAEIVAAISWETSASNIGDSAEIGGSDEFIYRPACEIDSAESVPKNADVARNDSRLIQWGNTATLTAGRSKSTRSHSRPLS